MSTALGETECDGISSSKQKSIANGNADADETNMLALSQRVDRELVFYEFAHTGSCRNLYDLPTQFRLHP